MECNNVQIVSDNYLCSACGACKVICPRDAIEFDFTNIGRLNSKVTDKCVNCGLCKKVCPSINQDDDIEDRFIGKIQSVFVGRAKEEKIYLNAQSGGLCTALSSYLLASKTVDAVLMCKILKGNSPVPTAVLVRRQEELYECQRSCYTPVDLLSSLKKLEKHEKIAVVGLPCQIHGLTLLVKNNLPNIVAYKIGLICDRVHCRGYQDTILTYARGDNKKIYWKKKAFEHDGTYYPYKTAPIVVENEKNESFVFPNGFRFAIKDLFTSPRCRVCTDKLNLNADVVLGDPWHMTDIDWTHGDSLALVRTKNGEELLLNAFSAGYLTVKNASLEEVLIGQQIESRRESVDMYRFAMNHLLPKTSKYASPISNLVNTKAVLKAEQELQSFIKWESAARKQIIKEAQYKIALAMGIWHRNLILTRLKLRLSNYLKTIKRNLTR